jgi:hypothetical protein
MNNCIKASYFNKNGKIPSSGHILNSGDGIIKNKFHIIAYNLEDHDLQQTTHISWYNERESDAQCVFDKDGEEVKLGSSCSLTDMELFKEEDFRRHALLDYDYKDRIRNNNNMGRCLLRQTTQLMGEDVF